ncbi:lamin tail domain-containing protein [Patescibacteria group bacterium]
MRTIFRIVLTTLLAALVWTGVAPTALASSCDSSEKSGSTGSYSSAVIISEAYPVPGDNEEEYIELYNTGTAVVDLAGWSLGDASTRKYTISAGDFVSTGLSAGGYFVVKQEISKIQLNNSSDSVYLYQPDDTLLDQTSYEGAESGLTWSRLNGNWAWSTQATECSENTDAPVAGDADEDDDSSATEDSTDAANAVDPKKYETSDNVLLNELLPNPSGLDSTDEWIEIMNTGASKIYLGGWQLTDQSTYYTIGDVSIASDERLLFEIGETGVNLNNSGDTVYLVDPYDTIIHGTEYTNAKDGYSWARFDDDWEWTAELTPGEANVATAEADDSADDSGSSNESSDGSGDSTSNTTDADIIPISLFRSLEDEQEATVEGVVTVLPDVFGSQYFYIQDDEAGIQVYSYRKDYPGLAVGDRVQVTGRKAVTRNETRIKTTTAEDIVVVGSGEEVAPRDALELEESFEGMLVQAEGVVVEQSGSNAIIDDRVKIVLKSNANIDKDLLAEGNAVTVLGIAAQYNEEYRLMPRSNDDIIATEADNVEIIHGADAASTNPQHLSSNGNSNDQGKTLLVIVIAGLVAIIAGYAARLKKDKLSALFKRGHKKTATTAVPAAPTTATAKKPPTIFTSAKKSRAQRQQ